MRIKAKQLQSFLTTLKWFDEKPRKLNVGKDYVMNKKGYRLLPIRTYHDFDNKAFYRVRCLGENEDNSLRDTFSYPPIKYNIVGRANLKSRPVLYASEDPVTAMYEVVSNLVCLHGLKKFSIN